jgi:hypothetical protein
VEPAVRLGMIAAREVFHSEILLTAKSKDKRRQR